MRKPLFLSCGIICLLLGAIGVVLPLLPTTPFIILAAYCFSKSSERLHRLLLEHRLFGPMIRDWEAYGIIPLRVKILSTSMMLLMVSYPIFFKAMPIWAIVGALTTVVIALVYIWSRPSAVACHNQPNA